MPVLENTYTKKKEVLKNLYKHLFNNLLVSNHTYKLMKAVASNYCRVQMFHLGKTK